MAIEFIEKVRCCLHGNRQVIYADYGLMNVNAPVAFHNAIRMLISISAAAELFLEGAYVNNEYLYRYLEIPIIME